MQGGWQPHQCSRSFARSTFVTSQLSEMQRSSSKSESAWGWIWQAWLISVRLGMATQRGRQWRQGQCLPSSNRQAGLPDGSLLLGQCSAASPCAAGAPEELSHSSEAEAFLGWQHHARQQARLPGEPPVRGARQPLGGAPWGGSASGDPKGT